MNNVVKAIFWDNDGVLVETEHLYFMASRQILASVDVTLTQDQFVELFMIRRIGAWHLAEQKGLSLGEIERLRTARNSLYSQLLRQERVCVEGVREVLDALYGRYLMGVVTSSNRDHFELMHQSTGLVKYFDFVLAGGDYPRHKPDPAPYLLAVERSGFDREECLAIEDSERGLRSAHAAGIRCLVIPGKLTRGSDFSAAHKVLGSISEVLSEV